MAKNGSMNRRDMLRLGAAGLGLGTAAGLLEVSSASAHTFNNDASSQARIDPSSAKAKSVIFMVSDGMSMGVPSLADPFGRLVREKETILTQLLRDGSVAHGLMDTFSADSLVTDSSAASSCWATGVRINNGALNVAPSGNPLTPIGRTVKRESGRRIGLVTTTRITHATPAGFAAVVPSRNQEDEIAQQYLFEEIDVLFGGGRKHFNPESRSDRLDLILQFQARGYAFHDDRAQMLKSRAADKMLGLFYNSHMPYTIDWNESDRLRDTVPTLAEMTSFALESLSRNSDGFLLQVEGGRVDHAAHANDAAAIWWDQLAFDDAIRVALDYQKENPDTLVIITTDHGNANPGLNGEGSRYSQSTQAFERLALAKASYARIYEDLNHRGIASLGSSELRDLLHGHLGLEFDEDEMTLVSRIMNDELPDEISRQHQNNVGLFGQVIGNHTGIGWTGVTHTADYALTVAIGPGQERFAGLISNTEVYAHLMGVLGLKEAAVAIST